MLTPLTPAITFRTSSAAAMYFITEVNPFVIDGILPGQPATVRLRAYVGESYEAARSTPGGIWGESNDVLIPQLGPRQGIHSTIPTPGLSGLQGFQIPFVPEPSSLALGLLGSGSIDSLSPAITSRRLAHLLIVRGIALSLNEFTNTVR